MLVIRLLFPALAASSLVAGCAMNRSQAETPEVALPRQFQSQGDAARAEPARAERWWEAMHDPGLNALVDRALADNLQLEVASSRIAAARALVQQARAADRPQVDLALTSNREQLSGNGLFGAATESGAFPDLYSIHRVGLDASWELDLFGANKARRNSARAVVQKATAERDALLLSLPAEVARIYVEHQVMAQQVMALQRSLTAALQNVSLLETRFSQGDVSESEVEQARIAADGLRSRLPGLQARRDALRHAMGTLLGTGEYVVLPEDGQLLAQATELLEGALPVGAPSDLLRRRPDLRAAEAQFRQAFADKQYAIADQYPRFVLGGSLGQESLRAGDLLKSASLAWTLVRSITLPIMDGGYRSAERSLRQADLDAATSSYRNEVLNALADVEQSLLGRNASRETLQAQESRLSRAVRQLDREKSRQASGEITANEVHQAEQVYQQELVDALEARGAALVSYIRLQKSLGGSAA